MHPIRTNALVYRILASSIAAYLYAEGAAQAAVAVKPLPDKVPCAVADVQDFQVPDRVKLSGFLGGRIRVNEANRLVKLDAARLLEGYRKRPGRDLFETEFVGKWLDAATMAWVYTGDPALRKKLDYVAAELVKCQLPDGYLGTYLDDHRWTEWDVWSHKYNLIGLMTYIRYTGNTAPLTACQRMADLLCATFGDEPGKRDIILAGEHVGLAPTSVLEPMVLLYRLTGESRYLRFCKYILRAWEHRNGPHVISTLLSAKRVDKVGNGKAYEMLSCLNGALEYYRTVDGDRQILDACLNAWQDIVDKRMYPTGTASYCEVFHDDYDLPSSNNVGETCVTVTWLQFNAQLLRLTGEARFADQLERIALNQLPGAQRPDGAAWGYYVEMEGRKPYSNDVNCCLSSGPRGFALLPTLAINTDANGVVVNLYDRAKAALVLRDSTPVSVVIDTQYPSDGLIRIAVKPASAKSFALKLRIPAWCRDASITVNGKALKCGPGVDGYTAVRREWVAGDIIELNLKLVARVLVGTHHQAGMLAVLYGPLVLAADEALLKPSQQLDRIFLSGSDVSALRIAPEPAPEKLRTWPGAQVFRVQTLANQSTNAAKTASPPETRLIPFADAGATGTRYRVWIPQKADQKR